MCPISTEDVSGSGFSLQTEFLGIKEWACEPSKLGLTPKEIEKRLNSVEDQLGDSRKYQNILENYELLQALVGSFAAHPDSVKLKLLGAVISGFNKFVTYVNRMLEGCFEGDGVAHAMGIYSVLITGMVQAAEKASSTASGKKNTANDFDWGHLKGPLVEAIKSCFSLDLGRVFEVQHDCDSLISNLVKTTHLLLESPTGLKQSALKKLVQECWVLAVTNHNYGIGMRTLILQDMNYFESLMLPLAEFFAMLFAAQEASPLLQQVFSHIGSHRFGSAESGTVKIITTFITEVTRLCPKESLKGISEFINQLDSESYVMRMAMVEVIGFYLNFLGNQEEKTEQIKAQVKSFLGVLEERLLDVNAFVRSKVIHTFSDCLRTGSLPITQRARILNSVVGRIRDKSSNVRRRAIQILGDFLRTHPFCVEGGELSLSYFTSRLEEINKLLASQAVPEDDPMAEEEAELEGPQPASFDPAQVSTLLLQKRYYTDAVQFVKQLEVVVPTLCQLLSSTVKTEVNDVIDFFVEAYLYRLDGAAKGIRRMMHLVWERDLSYEDGTKHSVKEYLFEAYKKVYLETDSQLSGKAKCDQIAVNLAGMIGASTISELTSLEPIVQAMLAKRWISDGVVQSLFALLLKGGEERKEALILLAMMAESKKALIAPKLDILIKVGFSPSTEPMIAQYTLIAIRSMTLSRLPADNLILAKILDFIRVACINNNWLEPISEALKTVYAIAEFPSVICEALVQELFAEIFCGMEDVVDAFALTRLLHIVGQVAACQSKHLDTIERHWKACRSSSGDKKKEGMDELDQIGGSAEDDLTDLIAQLRDQDLLYGEQSLLTVFGPLVALICSNGAQFPDPVLQRITTVVLAKFMAISSAYCQEHLALFLTILERSPDAVIRQNLVIAFGDLVQSFSRIIDENISYLFARLNDSDSGVRRNTLLVLTHLTLTGLIKVKGQIGEVAICLLDEDEGIAGLTRLFFHELASKDPALIYNHIPDILSSLSNAHLAEADFQAIMRFIMEFIRKEKQMESLLEKLCQRFRLCSTARQARDLSYCLSLVSYTSEKSLKRLVEAFPLYQDKLADYPTFRNFADVLQKAKKSCRVFGEGKANASSEARALFEDFEAKLLRAAGQNSDAHMDQCEDGGEGGDVFTMKASQKSKPAKNKKKSSRRSPFQLTSSEDEHDDADMGGQSVFPSGNEEAVQSGGIESDDVASGGEEIMPKAKVREKIRPLRRGNQIDF